jgi:hypothetical protein
MKELRAVILLLIGFGLGIAGAWLSWDLLTTIVTRYTVPSFVTDFAFPLPFFLAVANNWTIVFDVALALIGVGLGLTAVGAYLIGRLKE